MPNNHLRLRFHDDDDGTGKLSILAQAHGFSGESEAYFGIAQLEEFAVSLKAFPIPDSPRPAIKGGYWKQDRSGELEQEHVALSVYPIGRCGNIGVQVRLAIPLAKDDRRERLHTACVEIVTGYEPIARFSKEIVKLVRGNIEEAMLVGE